MKRKFSKILGVGLTLALLASLLLTATPVSALSQPSVTFDPTTDAEISTEDATYIISFQLVDALEPTDKIVVTFPEGTAVAATPTVTIEGWCTPALTHRAVTTPVAAGDVDTLEVELTWSADTITSLGTVKVTFLTGITNPDDAGDYTLTVGTRDTDDDVIEAAVTSASYEITVPTIEVLPGIVQLYNAADILMAQDTGDEAIKDMVNAAGENYTIIVGPGEYELDLGDTIVIDDAGVTLIASGDAEDTIIKSDGVTSHLILISAADVTVDGFTIGDVYAYHHGISIQGDDAIVKNNIITAEPTEIGIFINASGATVTGNELDEDCTMFLCAVSDCTISDNIFGEALNLYPGALAIEGLTVTDNTMIGSAAQAIDFSAEGTFDDILIEGNTISEATKSVGAIEIRDGAEVSDLRIIGNDITDNVGPGISIASDTGWDADNVIKFNTITGNDADSDGYGIYSAVAVDATFNWWGADGASASDLVITDPILAGPTEDVFSASEVGTGTTLDASTTVDVKVEGATDATIVAAKYIANPQEAIADAIAFYDVYVAGAAGADDVTIKFYVGDENTEVYLWSVGTQIWSPVTPVIFSAYGGFVSVDVDPAYLAGTPFALVAVEPAAAEVGTPTMLAPQTGDDTVSLTPTFAWEAVPDVDGYYFEFADNANFVTPLVKLDGDLGRLIVTAYHYVTELPYSTAYYWRVKAVSGTIEAGDLAESDWATSVFITMPEPEEELPPVVVEEAPPVIIEPIVEVITPAATEVTPGWIYAIIGVGGVLVIALLVLIVRTRRVA